MDIEAFNIHTKHCKVTLCPDCGLSRDSCNEEHEAKDWEADKLCEKITSIDPTNAEKIKKTNKKTWSWLSKLFMIINLRNILFLIH